MTTESKGYRKPWTNGAKAYPEVDTKAGMKAAIYRKRNAFEAIVRPGTPLYRTQKCAICGEALSTEEGYAFVSLSPKAKTATFKHYNCAWTALFTQIASIKIGA